MQITRAESWLPRHQNQVGNVRLNSILRAKPIKLKTINEIEKIANSSKL